MKNLFALFLLFFSIPSFGQEIHFFDVQGNRITKEQFEKKLNHRVNLALSFQKGKNIETRLIPRINKGVLSQATHKSILSNLAEVSGKIIDHQTLVVINYSQGVDSQGPIPLTEAGKTYQAMYLERFKQLKSATQFYVHSKITENDHAEYGIPWYPDKDKLIEKTFFKYFFRSGSFILINGTGEYYVYFGEHSDDQVIREAKRLLKN